MHAVSTSVGSDLCTQSERAALIFLRLPNHTHSACLYLCVLRSGTEGHNTEVSRCTNDMASPVLFEVSCLCALTTCFV